MAALLLGLGGWAVFASVEGAILAEGRVEASRTRLLIQHPEGGRLAELAVTDGQPVAAGALLARLDAGLLASEYEIVESQYIAALARAARLSAERDGAEALPLSPPLRRLLDAPGPVAAHTAAQVQGQRQLLATRRETLARQIDQLNRRRAQAQAQRDGLDGQIAALTAETALIAADRDRQADLLARGLTPSARHDALSREAARIDGARAAATAERAASEDRIAEIESQILALQAGRREEAEAALGDLGVALVELATRRQLLDERLSGLELRAPTAGRIHALSLGGPGAVLRPAEPLAELIPEPTAPLVALHIRPDDIDRVQPGQPVRLLLPASGGRDRPELPGHIARVSADTLEDPRSGLRHFRAEVALDLPQQDSTDPPRLHPGLPVEAHIRTGARSPLQWFLAPLTAQIGRALRED